MVLEDFLSLAFAIKERLDPFNPFIYKVRCQCVIKECHSHVEDFAVKRQVLDTFLALLLIQLPPLFAIEQSERAFYVCSKFLTLAPLILEIRCDLLMWPANTG